MLQLGFSIANVLHLILLGFFIYWSILLWRDHRKGFNGLTLGILALLILYNVHNELWSVVTTLDSALGMNVISRNVALIWRIFQLSVAIVGVVIFGRCYKTDEVDNTKIELQDNQSISTGGPEPPSGSDSSQNQS